MGHEFDMPGLDGDFQLHYTHYPKPSELLSTCMLGIYKPISQDQSKVAVFINVIDEINTFGLAQLSFFLFKLDYLKNIFEAGILQCSVTHMQLKF